MRRILLWAVVFACGTGAAGAQGAPSGPQRQLAPGESPADRVAALADRTRDLKRQEGFLPYYWDARRGQFLLEVSRWNEEFFYGSGLAGGAGTLEISLDRGPGGLRATTRDEGGERSWTLMGASRGEGGILGEGLRQSLLRDPTYREALDAAAAMLT